MCVRILCACTLSSQGCSLLSGESECKRVDDKNRYITEAPAALVAKCFALVGAYILSGLPYFFETVPWCAFVASGLFWSSSFFSGLYI